MRKKLIGIGSALAMTLLSASAASALTVGGAGYVGLIIDGIPSNPADEVNYINGLIKLAPGSPTVDCPSPGDTEDCNRQGSTIPSASLPVANLTLASKVETGNLTTFNPGDYEYVLAKYGNDGSYVWYLVGSPGPFTLPSNFLGTTGSAISHYSLYNATGTSVPDGGTTAALLGLSLVGLGMLRRRINL